MRWIRRPLAIGTVLSALVALPALFARPWADERFVMYMPEKLVGGNPLMLVHQVISETSAWTVEAGVFRPVSRLGFYLEHWLVVRTGIASGLAPNVVMSVVKVSAIALILATGLLTVDQYRRAAGADRITWRPIVLLLPVVFAGSLVLVNPAVHPLTLFPGLYIGTASVALLAPLWPGGLLLDGVIPEGWRRWGRYGLAAVLGAVLASMIELAWLAIPLALVHLALLAWHRFGKRWLNELSHSFAARFWAAMSIGLAAVFIPTRMIIANSCAGGACYQAATPRLGGDFLAILPFRIGSAFAPVGLISRFRVLQRGLMHHSWDLVFAVAVALLVVAVLVIGWRAVQGKPRGTGDGRLTVRAVAPLAVYYGVVILLASVLAATSSGLQDKGLNPAPWRETGFGWIAWAVLVAVVLAVAVERLRGRVWLALGLALIAFSVAATTLVDREDMRRVGRDPEGMLHVAAGWQLVDFDPSGNAARCETIDGLREVAASDSELRKMGLVAEYLDAAAMNNYGMVFCDDSS